MRISTVVLRGLSSGIFTLLVLLAAAVPVSADTGTYQILNYVSTLEPQSNGQVKITCEQEWKVLSGNIPWITVGLPNQYFSILSYSGAASRVSPENSGGFTGVRVDLDKDYQPGQTFSVRFTVLQGNLLERLTSENKWRINYTPGWYDRAITDHLQINLVSPVDIQSYPTLSPQPLSTSNNVITWEITRLSPGARFNILAESTDGSFLTAVETKPAPPQTSQGGAVPFGGSSRFNWASVIIILIILAGGGIIYYAIRQNRLARDAEIKRRVAAVEEEMAANEKKRAEIEESFDEYVKKKNLKPDAQGRYYDQSYGYITPAIYAAVILYQMQHHNQVYGGSAPPPPSHPSCACACVSCACACACACAGGGAAGCSRKTLHECPDCYKPDADGETKVSSK